MGCLPLSHYKLFLLSSFWELGFFNEWPLVLKGLLVGDCEVASAQWPILPWIGLVWAFYGLGLQLLRHSKCKGSLVYVSWNKWEFIFWPVLLILSFPTLGAYKAFPTVDELDCWIFRLKPWELWGQLAYAIFVLRLSLVESLNKKLLPSLSFLTKLEVSKSFWLVYIFHYPVIFMLTFLVGTYLRSDPIYSALGMLAVWPITEVFVKGFKRLVFKA